MASGEGAPAPSGLPAGTFDNLTVTNQFAALGAVFAPTTQVPGNLPGSTVTNLPGRIEITADTVLNLSRTRITGLNYMNLKATNHFAGSERAEISAVFHNRLKKHIPLQSDPTVIYGLPAFDGNLHKKDLSSPSPYNTYRVQGLPPGPIANPGIQAIRAALYPSDSRSLYFVSRNDGTHQFSATLIEHNKAVEKYQKRPFRRGTHSQTSIVPGEGALAHKEGVS